MLLKVYDNKPGWTQTNSSWGNSLFILIRCWWLVPIPHQFRWIPKDFRLKKRENLASCVLCGYEHELVERMHDISRILHWWNTPLSINKTCITHQDRHNFLTLCHRWQTAFCSHQLHSWKTKNKTEIRNHRDYKFSPSCKYFIIQREM